MLPVVHGLEAEYWGSVDFVYIDRENGNNAAVVQQYGVSYQPVFILISPEGEEIQRWFGYVDPEMLRAALNDYLAST